MIYSYLLGLGFLLNNAFYTSCNMVRLKRQDPLSDVCQLPKQPGYCRDQLQAYYYNLDMKQCESFIYSGCGGNDNLFTTILDCEEKCKPKYQNICKLDKDAGPCYGSIDRWYFNIKTGSCDLFKYGGCMGNENNFISFSQCENQCIKGLNAFEICSDINDPGPCKAFQDRWYFNLEKKTCEAFNYGGCGGNKNNFASNLECERTCYPLINPQYVCQLPKEIGPCKALIPRVFYNSQLKTCENFTYGGCHGNQNNFESITECEKICMKPKDRCELPKDIGPCKGSVPRYFYNSDTGKCEYFNYGGCKGNSNSFETVSQCQEACVVVGCSQPLKPGNCKGKIKRFYYNTFVDRCQEFTYTGCQKNKNNFETREECESICRLPSEEAPPKNPCREGNPLVDQYTYSETRCGAAYKIPCPSTHECWNTFCCPKLKNPVCYLEPIKGGCAQRLRRYFFNKEKNRCEAFSYSGCQGNENNFESLVKCQEACEFKKEIGKLEVTTVFQPRKLCPYGEPLRDPHSNRARSCGFGPTSVSCPINYECRGDDPDIISICCPVEPTLAIIKKKLCLHGQPLLDPKSNRARTCGFGLSSIHLFQVFQVCPSGYVCTGNDPDTSSVCCPSSSTTGHTEPSTAATFVNPCSSSEPLYHEKTNNPIQCGPSYMPCPHTHKCTFVSDTKFGVCCLGPTPVEIKIHSCSIGEPLKDPVSSGKYLTCDSTHKCPKSYECQKGICCKTKETLDVCKKPLERGLFCGSNRSKRYFYDSLRRRCRAFMYNGCQGGPNNFWTRTDCEKACPSKI